MEELKQEICTLINTLEKAVSAQSEMEALVLGQLKRFLKEIEGPGRAVSDGADAVFAELRQFWLDSVPWCSELSKDIEKVIIIYGDLREAER